MKATFTDADIVHCHEPSSLLIGAILKPFKRYKLIYDVHEFYPELVALRMGRGLLKSSIIFAENTFEKVVTFCFVDGVISVNRDIRKKFNFLCMNHVIIENYPSANQFYNAGSDEELVYIGTLTEERGILQMVQAFKLVNRGKLTIVGKFWNASYEKKVMEAINGANVNFIGSVPYPDVPTYVAHARAGLCVLNDSERHKNCIPSKFLELMLASKPMIVTDIWDGFIRESGAGFTVKYGDIEDLAKQIIRIVTNCDSCTATFTQIAGIEAYRGSQDDTFKMVKEFKERRDIIIDGLNKIDGIKCTLPKGAFYAFPNVTEACRNLGLKDSRELQQLLLHKGDIAVLPRTSFGVRNEGETEEYVRLSYATSKENIAEGLRRMRSVIEK